MLTSHDVGLLIAERERRKRSRLQSLRAEVAALVPRAQEGDWRPLFELQWPGVLLDTFQADILDALFDPTVWGVFVKGNTGCGKSAVAGMGIALFFSIWPDPKAVITSATFEHAKSILFGETVAWLKRMQIPPAEFIGTHRIGDGQDRYIEVINPATDEAFSGRHGQNMLFCFDEATIVADSRFRMARTQATKFLAIANPRTLSGYFRQAFPVDSPDENQTRMTAFGRCRFQTIDGETVRNVREKRLDKPLGPIGGIQIEDRFFEHGEPIPPAYYAKVRPIIPGQVAYDTFLTLKSETDSRWVGTFCHGRFPTEDPERQLILAGWLNRAHDKWRRWTRARERAKQRNSLAAWKLLTKWFPVEAFGLDVAASEQGDETILSAGGRRGIFKLHACRETSTMQIVGWVIRTAQSEYGIDLRLGEHPVAVDVDGLGHGVADRLKEQGVRVVEIRGNDTAEDAKLYVNRRAERYAQLGLRLDPRGKYADDVFMLPEDYRLSEELCAVEKVYSGSEGMKFAVIPKRKPAGSTYEGPTIYGKLGRSPDRGDSVSYCFDAIRSGPARTLEDWIRMGAF